MELEDFRDWLAGGTVEAPSGERPIQSGGKMKVGRFGVVPLSSDLVRSVLDALPDGVEIALIGDSTVVLAGGFIRATLAGEDVNDVDLFVNRYERAKILIEPFGDPVKRIQTGNAFTATDLTPKIQSVFRWQFWSAEQLIRCFDLTISQAAIWYDGRMWRSVGSLHFEEDVRNKVIRYANPEREPDKLDIPGTLARVIKFHEKGYSIPKRETAGDTGGQ